MLFFLSNVHKYQYLLSTTCVLFFAVGCSKKVKINSCDQRREFCYRYLQFEHMKNFTEVKTRWCTVVGWFIFAF
jgi:hypothetical protein